MKIPALISSVIGLLIISPVMPARSFDPPTAAAPATPEPAQTLLDAAQKRAKAAGKNVFVVFHASWCGWCKRLDEKVWNDPTIGKLMATHYEIVRLDVSEDGKQELENPGGDKILANLGGENSGLPFYAILNPAGKKLTDANRMPSNGNIGYPAAPEEITAFVKILKETAPKMTEAERTAVLEHLKKNAPPH
jgi:thiol:disulfide interchange protein